MPPIQIVGNELPANLDLLFRVMVTTQFGGTSFTGGLMYSWYYGDETPPVNGSVSDSHRFLHAGDYTVTCTITSPLGSVSDSLEISVFEGGISCVKQC